MSNPVKIFFSGDFCPIGRSEDFIINCSVNDAFGDILPVIRESDIVITNLECPLVVSASPIQKTGPNLKSYVDTAGFLKKAGFNLVALANNHIMDYGPEGLYSTIKACERVSLDYIGVGNSLDEARTIHYREKSGLKLAFINFCENEWSTTYGNKPGANPLNPVTNHYDIKKARENADYVFVILHGNNEMYHLPSPRIKELCHFYIDSGANFVICHHSHVYSGYETYNNGMIFYGLGNFLFDKARFRDHNWNNGILVQILLERKNLNFKIFPIRQSDINPGARLAINEYFRDFTNSINKLNNIIINDNIIKNEFVKFCTKKSTLNVYNSFLEPYSNKFITALFKRRYFPSLVSKQKKMLLGNLIRCESHRDVLNLILKK